MTYKAVKVSVSLIFLLTLVACASGFVKNSFDTLSVSKATYESTLSIAGDLYKQGLMSEAQKNEAVRYGDLYRQVHNESVSALLAYKTSGASSDKEKYLHSMSNVSARLSMLIEYMKPFILKKEDK